MIASDMDGTLLDTQGELNPEFFQLFKELRKHGIQFAAASGRQYHNLKKLFSEIDHDLIYISDNGSYICDRGQVRQVQPMPYEQVCELIHHSRKLDNIFAMLCSEKHGYVENGDPVFLRYLHRFYTDLKVVDDLTSITDEPLIKFSVCDFKGSKENCYPHFQPWSDRLQVKISGPHWMDITHLDANKGHAIELLQKEYGISPQQTMVFGDNFNDLEMLQAAYYSYAMGNAHEDIKRAARFVARPNSEGGVIEVLKQVISALNTP